VARLTLTLPLLALACVPPPAAPRTVLGEDEPLISGALPDGLAAFVRATAATRKATPKGAPMPQAHVDAWQDVFSLVDRTLEGTPEGTPTAQQLARIRLTLEGAFDDDRAVFGDIPPSLAQRLPDTFARLRTRLVALTARRHHANPRAFLWPTSPVEVTSPWGDRQHPIRNEPMFHQGIDLAAERAQPIRAAEAGTVIFAGWNGGHGKQVELQHDEHWSTRYSHLSTLLVEPGHTVKKGEVIGLAGATGLATGPHLHFELWRDGETLDPELALPPPPVDGARVELIR
jgi:murein DD-endopeptidase MepM/ murein hydrolase activator NlpD